MIGDIVSKAFFKSELSKKNVKRRSTSWLKKFETAPLILWISTITLLQLKIYAFMSKRWNSFCKKCLGAESWAVGLNCRKKDVIENFDNMLV